MGTIVGELDVIFAGRLFGFPVCVIDGELVRSRVGNEVGAKVGVLVGISLGESIVNFVGAAEGSSLVISLCVISHIVGAFVGETEINWVGSSDGILAGDALGMLCE